MLVKSFVDKVLKLCRCVELVLNGLLLQPVGQAVTEVHRLVSFALNFVHSSPIIDGLINLQRESFPVTDLADVLESAEAFQFSNLWSHTANRCIPLEPAQLRQQMAVRGDDVAHFYDIDGRNVQR